MFNVGKVTPPKNKISPKRNPKITGDDVLNLMKKLESFKDYDKEQLQIGIKIEMEHINKAKIKTPEDRMKAEIIAEWIAKAHLEEDYWYYNRLIQMEKESENDQERFKKKKWDYNLVPPFIHGNTSEIKGFEMNAPEGFDYEVEYEQVITLEHDEAETVFNILEKRGEQSALEYLMQWHYPGEHPRGNKPSYGKRDSVYREGNYTMFYNDGLGYIGLDYKIEKPV